MKTETKKIEEKIFTAGEVGSMLENIDSTMKILAENHSGVIDRLDGIDNRLNGIDNRLDGIDNRLDSIDNRLDRVDVKIDRLQDDMVEVKFELKKKVSIDQFEKLEKRVVKLEKLSPAH